MLITPATNTWGVADGLDTQRADLWRLDLTPALQYFTTVPEQLFAAIGLNKSELPDSQTLVYYAARVALPVQKITTRSVTQNTTPRNFPSYFDALDTVRVEFIADARRNCTGIFTLLQVWRAFTRTGRVSPRAPYELLLPAADFKPQFKFNVILQLLCGVTYDEPITTADATQQIESYTDLAASVEYTLVDCWPRSVQQNAIDRKSAAQIHVITAQFQPSEIQ